MGMSMELMCSKFMVPITLLLLLLQMVILPQQVGAIDDEIVRQVREQTTKSNTTCILVFGDSSVDPGNNNYIPTTNRGNFPPYGKNFDNGTCTGRFSNGKLATDFIAEAFGYRNILRGFLEPHMEKEDLLHGVSFASAGSGYDDLTANLTNVLTITRQVEYLMHYKIHLSKLIGKTQAAEVLRNAVYILSFGTNDFVQNYFEEFDRAKQFTVVQYQNYLISRMALAITKMHRIGARKVAVVGVPPLGCFPLIEMIRDDDNKCDGPLDSVAISFNSMIKQKLAALSKSLSIKTAYIDIYGSIMSAVQNPKQYGFMETAKGCCGTGTVEYGDSCKGMSTCADPTKYVYWDAVHPTETMYKIVADDALKSIVVGDFLAN